ncbi:hypothetical protein D3C81_1244900 [compost metagenome]
MPHAVVSLERAQGAHLARHHLRQIATHAGVQMLAHQFDKFGDCHGDPRVAARPKRPGKVVFIDKRPAVIPQPTGRIAEIAGVQQKLVSRLVNQVATLEHNPRHAKEKAGHKQRVVPELAGVGLLFHHVLEAALFSFGQITQQGVGPVVDRFQQILTLMLPRHQRQHDHRCGGIDLYLRQPFGDLRLIPCEDRLLQRRVLLVRGVTPESVKPDADFPLPLLKVDRKTVANAHFIQILQTAKPAHHAVQRAHPFILVHAFTSLKIMCGAVLCRAGNVAARS